MENIKFINRKNELKFLKSLKNNYFLIVTGRRRIGKTRLLLECFKDAYYIFIWPDKSIQWILEKISEELNIPRFIRFSDMLEYLLDKNKPLILDEFQNLMNIDKSVFGEIQRIVDKRKFEGKPYKLIVCGSSYSLLNKIFYDYASPLYGRRTHELRVEHLPKKDLFKSLRMNLKDFIELWSVFEGVPYYYEFVNTKLSARENIKQLLLYRNAKLQEEGKAVISIEFGADSKTYNTILSAIAEGKTKLNEIASVFDNKVNVVTKYLDTLKKQFNLVRRLTPVLAGKRSKEGIYEITDNFLRFWFFFIEKNRYLIEQKRENEFLGFFEKHFNDFVGKMFEKFCLELLADNYITKPTRFTSLGKQWGRIPGAKPGENTYEIDILALNDQTKEILFAECKWQEKLNPEPVLEKLLENSQHVDWNKENRKETFALFAKSFSRKIQEFEGRSVLLFDVKDMERAVKGMKDGQ